MAINLGFSAVQRYTIHAADMGECWIVGGVDDPADVLATLESERRLYPFRTVGVFETANPERGDVEDELIAASVADERN
jgi:hypothetical protein